MKRYGVEYCVGKWNPAQYLTVRAENLLTAWMLATRDLQRLPGHVVLVVFSLDGPYEEGSLLDYSNTTGSGDPH